MSDDGSITGWLANLQAGDKDAAQGLWERFAGRLIGLARVRLQTAPRRAADEEDVVLSAFDSFCRGAEQGRYPKLADRDDLWHLLVTITVRKVSDQLAYDRRQKRGGGTVQTEADLPRQDDRPTALDALADPEPTPEMVAEVEEQCRRLLDELPDADSRSVARWKLEGYTNDEIADRLGCARSTVQRKLRLIQTRWAKHVA